MQLNIGIPSTNKKKIINQGLIYQSSTADWFGAIEVN